MESERREWAAERAELEEIRKGAAGKATREASEAAAKEAIDGRNESALQQPRVQVQQAEQGYRNHTGMSLFMSQNDKRVPKFIDGQKLHLWSSRFEAFLTARGLIGTIEPTSDPIRVAGGSGGMAELDRLIYRYGQEKVEKCAKAWEFLMEAMQGHPVEERMHATGSVEGAWQAVMIWYQPRGDAESTWRKTLITSPCRGMRTPICSPLVSKGSSTYWPRWVSSSPTARLFV